MNPEYIFTLVLGLILIIASVRSFVFYANGGAKGIWGMGWLTMYKPHGTKMEGYLLLHEAVTLLLVGVACLVYGITKII